MAWLKVSLGGLACLLFASFAGATDHYVSPRGRSTGDGSIASPWDLDTALGSPSGSQPAAVQPGDTIWLRGGIYHPMTDNGFISHVAGTANNPITVRNYNGERATLDGGSDAFCLAVYGSYAWYWGLEIMSSTTNRHASEPGSGQQPNCLGVGVYGPGNKFINLVVHDTGQGFSSYNSSPDSEFYGNIVYYNGWIGPDRNHGHGMYMQNSTGTKLLSDNFVGDNADEGIQVYGSGTASLVGITVTGNSLYNTSSWPFPHYQYNLVLGGGQTQHNNAVTDNYVYFTPSKDYGFVNLGQYTAGRDLVATDNVFVGGYVSVAVEGMAGPLIFTGNRVYNSPSSLRLITLGLSSGQTLSSYKWDHNAYYGLNRFYYGTYDGNNTNGTNADLTGWKSETGFDSNSTFTSSAPTGAWIYVRPNKYEAKRASVTIYNWDLLSAVNVSLSGVLALGDRYVIRDAQNFFGPAVVNGVYTGAAVSIPMMGLTKATPVGFMAPAHTAPQFGTFVVMPTGAPGTPPKANGKLAYVDGQETRAITGRR
jgi:hypothetical protein